MNGFINPDAILTEFDSLKKAYKDLKIKIFEECPECGQAQFRNLLHNAAAGIVILDDKGTISFSNEAFENISGSPASDINGTELTEFLIPEDDPEPKEYLRNLFSTPGTRTTISLSLTDKNGEYHYVDLNISSVTNPHSTKCSCICIFNDVTIERERDMQREELIEELMEAKEMQENNSAQLAMLLHELDEKNLELEKEIAERKRAEEKLRQSEERFKNLSITDQLTGLYNRRHMVEVAEREVKACNRVARPLSFILMDIDDFKIYNDTYGHAAGDVVLERIGKIIKETIRYTDKAFRYGGEEFLIILPGTDGPTAVQIADEIRKAVYRERYYPNGDEAVRRSMSIGVAQYMPGEPLEWALKKADDNMYNSKIRGKNKVYFSCETGGAAY